MDCWGVTLDQTIIEDPERREGSGPVSIWGFGERGKECWENDEAIDEKAQQAAKGYCWNDR